MWSFAHHNWGCQNENIRAGFCSRWWWASVGGLPPHWKLLPWQTKVQVTKHAIFMNPDHRFDPKWFIFGAQSDASVDMCSSPGGCQGPAKGRVRAQTTKNWAKQASLALWLQFGTMTLRVHQRQKYLGISKQPGKFFSSGKFWGKWDKVPAKGC